jgi:4-amino-4-deoxy-L-arabinose transferase-like glycosyltransferase
MTSGRGAASGRSLLGGVLVFAAAAVLLLGTAGDYGLTDDEPAYLRVEERLAQWFGEARAGQGFTEEALQAGWAFARKENRNLPVPALVALGGRAAFGGLATPLVASRIGPCLLMAGSLGLAFVLVARRQGLPSALGTAGALLLMPHAFGHAHLNATDAPASCFFLLTLLAWIGGGGRPWPSVGAGVLLGLGLGTKASLFVLPVLVLGSILLFKRWRALPGFALLCGTGTLVLLLVCPMWWAHPVLGLGSFLGTTAGRSREIWAFDAYYLGRVYLGSLPWHNGLILPLVQTPPLTLALGLLAGVRAVGRRDEGGVLLLMGALALPLLRMLPGAPGHDGIRLMLPSLFCLAPLAGHALAEVLGGRALLPFLLVGALEVGTVHPFELSYYSELVLGLRGATALGFETTYWFDALTPRVLGEIQERLPKGARVWTFPAYPGFHFLREWGLWRDDLHSGREGAGYLVLYSREASIASDPSVREIVGRSELLYSRALEGVPLVRLYRLPEDPRP